MLTRLLITTFTSSLVITAPLLACESDELTASSASTSTNARDLWQERLLRAVHTMTPQDYHDALQAFIDLDANQKTFYKDTYTRLMKWHLAHTQSTPERLLQLAQDCLHLGHTEGLARASFAYATHPNRSSTYKTMPLQSAFAMQAAMHKPEASALYSLALTLRPQDFTLQDYRYATQIFGQLRQKELGLKTYKEMIARIPHQDLAAEDFISAAGCFIAAGSTDVAKTYLTYYFDKEKNIPAPIAYRLCATIATHEGNTERACEYWQMALGKHSPMHFADYANAASCFVKGGNPSKAALLWKKALSAPDFTPDYTSYFFACDVYAQVKDYESALECVEAFMKLRPET
ncbi:MAG: tetratricopeptide repeat protein, partial [Proteobacteria bacterium]|nr:tetratricopeptide repeat protein [Pseudomonadota bacterium]